MFKAAFATSALISATAGLNLRAAAQSSCSSLDSVTDKDCDVHAAQNLLRTDPNHFLQFLDDRIASFNAEGTKYWTGSFWMNTQEGVSAVQEARDTLAASSVKAAFMWSDTLYMASKTHCDDIGPKGTFSHTGSDDSSPSQRIYRYTSSSGSTGENLSAGTTAAEDIVMQLYIDDGVSSRGHRTNMMSTNFTYEGTATCTHATYSSMSAFNFASFSGSPLNAAGEARYACLDGDEDQCGGDSTAENENEDNTDTATDTTDTETEEEGAPAGFTPVSRVQGHEMMIDYNGQCFNYTLNFRKSGAWGETCWDFNAISWIGACDPRYPDQVVCLTF